MADCLVCYDFLIMISFRWDPTGLCFSGGQNCTVQQEELCGCVSWTRSYWYSISSGDQLACLNISNYHAPQIRIVPTFLSTTPNGLQPTQQCYPRIPHFPNFDNHPSTCARMQPYSWFNYWPLWRNLLSWIGMPRTSRGLKSAWQMGPWHDLWVCKSPADLAHSSANSL